MMYRLKMKERWVLDYIRDNPGVTIKEVSEASPTHVFKTEEWAQRSEQMNDGMPPVDYQIPAIEYQVAQTTVRKLLDMGFIRRDDEIKPYRHFFVSEPEIDQGDELEQLFAAKAWQQ